MLPGQPQQKGLEGAPGGPLGGTEKETSEHFRDRPDIEGIGGEEGRGVETRGAERERGAERRREEGGKLQKEEEERNHDTQKEGDTEEEKPEEKDDTRKQEDGKSRADRGGTSMILEEPDYLKSCHVPGGT
ncbi:hypothetical protein NDU88_004880 [Pleurodeles waltl]|uniref:Uncharacterized protein n=1 Tax=Pleurodeles waltl TaxID=8319 RepID=A0AAV7PDU8_PLEWA|nr:hypothetical protein NDU88_004880 [Pleurodeles waltl]